MLTVTVNYRIEKVVNGFILHRSEGKDGAMTKTVYLTKTELLAHLDKVLVTDSVV